MNTETPDPPEISICIANYNGGELVFECVRSVFSQQGDFTYEVLLHDDASTDDAVEHLRSAFPQMRIIESQENVGFCISNNRMAEAALGRYLLLLNNDAALRPGSLAAFVNAARVGHDHDLLGLPQYARHDGALIDRGYEFDIFMNPIPVFRPGTHVVGAATGACLWIPRSVWLAVGGFPPWFESVAEDIFLCQAARLLGHSTYVLNAPGFVHWIGKNLGGGKVIGARLRTTARRRALSERNKTAVLLLCDPWWALLSILPLHAVLLATEAALLWIQGSGRGKISRIYGDILPWLWKHRGELRSLRRRLQTRRAISGWHYMRRFRLLPQKLRLLLRYSVPEIR